MTGAMRLFAALALALLTACAPPSPDLLQDDPSEENSNALEARTLTIRPDQVIAADFAGFGAQYNQNLYSDASRDLDGVTPANLSVLEDKLSELGAGYVRIFFDAAAAPDEQASFVRTVALAQRGGATINITYWHGPYKDPKGQMKIFAQALAGLFAQPSPPSSLDVTIQNEVNTTPCVTQEIYGQLYVALDGELRALGARDHVRFIGGDLLRGGVASDEPESFEKRVTHCMDQCGYTRQDCVDKAQANASTQEAWLQDFATRPVVGVPGAKVLSDLFAGYSAHIYWNYWDRNKMIERLDGLKKAIDSLPVKARKPLYITEFGARGLPTAQQLAPGVATDKHPALDADGHKFLASNGYPIASTYIEAFQTGRFAVEALKRGVVGIVRWDAFDARYQKAPMGDYSMLMNGKNDWAEMPSFPVVSVLDEAGVRGWNVVAVDGDGRQGVVAAALAGPGGGRSLFVANDTAAKQVITVHGLPKSQTLRVIEWSRTLGRTERKAKTNATGTTVVQVPLHAITVVTTKS